MVATAPNFATINSSSQTKNQLASRLRGSFSQGLSPNLSNLTSNQVDDQGVDTTQALDTLDQVMTQVESSIQPEPLVPDDDTIDHHDLGPLSQASMQTVLSQTNTLNPAAPTRVAKETIEVNTTNPLETASANQQVVEIEKAKEMEIPVEVESYVQKVVDSKDQLPEEIVVADDNANLAPKAYPKMPVVVLPITPEQDEEGQKKPPSYSLRWLVELSHKLMKIFSGAVIYREEE